MSNLPSLDEMSEERLQRELDRRKSLRDRGLCDYCERIPTATPCRFPKRHYKNISISDPIDDYDEVAKRILRSSII
jgi:hypothetical protein